MECFILGHAYFVIRRKTKRTGDSEKLSSTVQCVLGTFFVNIKFDFNKSKGETI